jgi:hypothetical protein
LCDLFGNNGGQQAANQQLQMIQQQQAQHDATVNQDISEVNNAFAPFWGGSTSNTSPTSPQSGINGTGGSWTSGSGGPSGGGTSDYFTNYQNAYENALNPQLDYQYGAAQDKLNATLAGTDRDQGSTGAYDNGQLYQQYGSARAGIGNSAVDATNQLKGTVNNAENQLYGLAENATDPLSLATQAQATAGSIVAPSSYPSLGNVFGDILSPVAGGLKSNQGGMNPVSLGSLFNFNTAPISGGGSGTIS